MKSIIVLFFAGIVLLVSGQFFGWWNAPVPGLERVPSYELRKTAREAERSARRKAVGLEEDDSLNDEDVKRRSDALKSGGGVGNY